MCVCMYYNPLMNTGWLAISGKHTTIVLYSHLANATVLSCKRWFHRSSWSDCLLPLTVSLTRA